METSIKRITFPAPFSDSVELPNGQWAHTAWTQRAMTEYRAIGGWFIPGPQRGVDARYNLAPVVNR